jgi:predicted glycosyltransferase
MWSKGAKSAPAPGNMNLFIGEEEDIPDTRFGFLLPRRRDWARSRCRIVGYVLPFDPRDYADRGALRARLGYDASPLIICAIGGTAIGKELLELCGQAYPIAREAIKNLRMVLVCGPRLAAGDLDIPAGVEVRGYVPALYEHLAASDLAIVQGGGSVTLELTALGRPFLYFPIEGHFEQEITVAGRLRRHGAGVNLRASTTTPARLAEAIAANIGKPVSYAKIRTDGARTAAVCIAELLGWPAPCGA